MYKFALHLEKNCLPVENFTLFRFVLDLCAIWSIGAYDALHSLAVGGKRV